MNYKLFSVLKEYGNACLPASCALLAIVAAAQVNQPSGDGSNAPPPPSRQQREAYERTVAKERLPDALARLKQGGEFFPADAHVIAEAGATQAVPDLEKRFDSTTDPSVKDSIASALVRLGDKNHVWWDYLVQGTADALASDAPSVARFDANGKLIPGISPEFIAWAKAHNLSLEAATKKAMSDLPGHVLLLGESGDPRAIPLLRQALLSPNYMVQASAAVELARLNDKASIPLIIAACQQAPADAAAVIANPLSDFDDPQGQSAAKEYAPLKNAK